MTGSVFDRASIGDDCWEWQGCKDRAGYGRVQQPGRVAGKRRWTGAHRLAWEESSGPIPPGLFVCHHCDNPSCIRPSHLFLGTPADNSADMAAKGRARGRGKPGEKQVQAKLSDADVIELRRLYSVERLGRRALARRFGISPNTVKNIIARRTWRHLPGPTGTRHKAPPRKLTPETAEGVRALYQAGWSQRRLASRFGVGRTTIVRLLRGETYAPRDPTGPREDAVEVQP